MPLSSSLLCTRNLSTRQNSPRKKEEEEEEEDTERQRMRQWSGAKESRLRERERGKAVSTAEDDRTEHEGKERVPGCPTVLYCRVCSLRQDKGGGRGRLDVMFQAVHSRGQQEKGLLHFTSLVHKCSLGRHDWLGLIQPHPQPPWKMERKGSKVERTQPERRSWVLTKEVGI